MAGSPVMPATSGATWSHSARGGPLEASWSQIGTTSLPIPPGTRVELWDDGDRVWWGSMGEQSGQEAGKWHAVGPVKSLERWPALTGATSQAPTNDLIVALDALAADPYSPITSYGPRPGTPGLSGFGSVTTPDTPSIITSLLDDVMAGGNLDGHVCRWWVDEHQRLTWELISAIPVTAHVRLRDIRVGTTRDGAPTHIHATFKLPVAGDSLAWTVVESSAPGEWADTKRWGEFLDLADKGKRTPAQAQAAAAARLGRPALTDALTLSVANCANSGQVPMPGRLLVAGDRIRVWLTDSMDSVSAPWIDVLLEETRHTDASSTIEADPEGKPARGRGAFKALWRKTAIGSRL